MKNLCDDKGECGTFYYGDMSDCEYYSRGPDGHRCVYWRQVAKPFPVGDLKYLASVCDNPEARAAAALEDL